MKHMKTKGALALVLAGAFALSGCGGAASSSYSAPVQSAVEPGEMFTATDLDDSYAQAVSVTLANGASKGGTGVTISGNTVTFTAAGTYILTGALAEGQLVVDAQSTAKVHLVLNGVQVTNHGSASLYVKQADKVVVTLAPGSENTLAATGDFVQSDDNNVDGAVFSKDDLTFNGTGSLEVESQTGHGIVGKDDVVFTAGVYNITANGHAIAGKDSLRIAGGTFNLSAGKDGLHSENTEDTTLGFCYIAGGSFAIDSTGDGVSAETRLTIEGGAFDITAGGGAENVSTAAGWGAWGAADDGAAANTSAKGLKSGGELTVTAGTFVVSSADDCVHTNASMSIQGGTFTLSSGDDGLHADGDATVGGGAVTVAQSYEGLEGQRVFITGGKVNITASDDGINAAGGADGSSLTGRAGRNGFASDGVSLVEISGGTVQVNARGDGIDSNGDLTITGGEVYVSGPTDGGNGALDFGGSGTVTGGILVAAGSSAMAQNLTGCAGQASLLYGFAVAHDAGDGIALRDKDGTLLAEYTPAKQYECVVISAPGLRQEEGYTLTCGSETAALDITGDSCTMGTLNAMGGRGGQPQSGGWQGEGGYRGGTGPQGAEAPPPGAGGTRPQGGPETGSEGQGKN